MGYCFPSISLFIYLFVSLSVRLRENGWTDLHEIFREGLEWPRDDVIQFWDNSVKWIGGSKVNLLSPDIAVWFDCCLLAVLCCHLATESVMKLLFLAFFYIAKRGRGLLCFAPQLVLFLICTRFFLYYYWFFYILLNTADAVAYLEIRKGQPTQGTFQVYIFKCVEILA